MQITARLINQGWTANATGEGNTDYTFRESYLVNWNTLDDGTPNPWALRIDDPIYVYELQDPDDPTADPNKRKIVQGLPTIGQWRVLPKDYDDGGLPDPGDPPPTPNERNYYCSSFTAERKEDPSSSAQVWIFHFDFETGYGLFDLNGAPLDLDKPEEQAPVVQIGFAEHYEKVRDAEFLGLALPDDGDQGFVPNVAGAPPWLTDPAGGGTTYRGPVVDSAMVQKDVEKPRSEIEIASTVTVADMTSLQSWHDLVWTTNLESMRIQDGARGSYDHTFNPNELLLTRIIIGTQFWHSGQRYTRLTFNFRIAARQYKYNDRAYYHYHYEPDQGAELLCVVGQNSGPYGQNGTGGLHTQDDVDRLVNQGGTQNIALAVDRVLVPNTVNVKDAGGANLKAVTGSPTRLNGWGQPTGYPVNAGATPDNNADWFLAYRVFRSVTWSSLHTILPQTNPVPPTPPDPG